MCSTCTFETIKQVFVFFKRFTNELKQKYKRENKKKKILRKK